MRRDTYSVAEYARSVGISLPAARARVYRTLQRGEKRTRDGWHVTRAGPWPRASIMLLKPKPRKPPTPEEASE